MVGETPCKVCGTPIPRGQNKCPLCGTEFSRSESGKVHTKVTSEKKAAEKLDIDIADPEVRKVLEELTLIPGISRRGALVLYKQGIRSVSDFIKKAMPGEALSERYAQVIANRLAIDSAKGTDQIKERKIPCPSCRSPNKATAKKCGVCGAQISTVKKNVDLERIQGRVNETIKEVLGDFAESEDFGALPSDMKAEIAAVLSSEREITEEEVKDVAKTLTALPEDMTQIVDDIALDDSEEADESSESEGETSAPDKNSTHLKKKQILTARLERWRKMGYDVSELEPLVDGDFEAFKAKAKDVLSSKLNKAVAKGAAKPSHEKAEAPKKRDEPASGKTEEKSPEKKGATPEDRAKFLRQIGVWKERGYDVKGLAELLETDMIEFKKRSMAMLKSHMKK
jgi:RNA polymerase subunit RPABC4/transcription elongation factor Spt4